MRRTPYENPYDYSFSVHFYLLLELYLLLERDGSRAAGRDFRHAQRAR
jgi:hypothetical protein